MQTYGPSDDLCRIKAYVISKVSYALREHEIFYKEKAGNHWLQLGDRGTHFFHVMTKINAARKNSRYVN